jgi:hypothetical protein
MSSFRLKGGLAKHDGFAIPAAIFAIIVVSLLALSGLYMAQTNATASTGIRRGWKAFNAANAGAAHVLATWDRWRYGGLAPGGLYDTGWQTLPDGSEYRATIRRVDDSSDPNQMLFRVGTVGRPGPGISAQRSLVTMTRAIRPQGLCCDGAMKARGLLDIRGTGAGVKVSGLDLTPTAWGGHCTGPLADLPGISILESDDISVSGSPELEGAPAIQEDATISDDDFTQFGELTYADLAASADKQLPSGLVLDEIAPSTTGEGACQTSSANNWGDPLVPGSACWDYLPVVHVGGDLKVSGSGYGQGVLLVDGDFQVTGTFDFYGIVIVQGHADFRGTTDLHGGLLVRNGVIADSESYLRGGTTIQYSSCSAARALSQATVAKPLDGRYWFDVLE